MNILVVTYFQVYPFTTGASIAQFGMIEYLSNLCNISLLLPEGKPLTKRELTELQRLLPKVKIYMLGQSKQEEDKTKIGSYLYKKLFSEARDLIKSLKPKIKKILKLETEQPSEEEFLGMYNWYSQLMLHSKEYVEKFHQIIIDDKIDIVQLEFLQNLNLLTVVPPGVKTVFVEHECIYHRIKSHAEAKNIASLMVKYYADYYTYIEFSLLERCHGIMTFNHMENSFLQSNLKAKNIAKNTDIKFCISPYPVLDNDFQELKRELFTRPNKLVFVGGESHLANKDAVEWFLEEAAVEILEKFGLKLYVVGEWTADTIKQYKNHPSGVEFVGFIDNLYDFCKGSVSIAPVRMGGGLKTKIMMAMAQGIPVICSKFALEGINAKHLESAMIAEDKKSFCFAVEYLLSDLERTFTICQNAQDIIKSEYSQSVVSDIRYKFYQNILQLQDLNTPNQMVKV